MASQGTRLASLLVIVLHSAGARPSNELDQQLCDASDIDGGNYTEVVQLLERGADIEQCCCGLFCHTALIQATSSGWVKISDVLLEHGADLDARDEFGRTALHRAAEYGDLAVVKLLVVKHGADLEVRDRSGRTALHLASIHNNLAVVKLLVANGADPLATNQGMETPMATGNGVTPEWLLKHGGADPTPTSLESWEHALRFHPWEVAACAGVGVLLAGFKTTFEWMHPRRVIATRDPSPALVGELVPSTGALRLAAKAIAKDHRCGSFLEPMKLLANSFAVLASLLFVCGPCMWIVKPVYVATVAGPAFLVPALCIFGLREVVDFPVLVIAAKTPSGRCRVAVTILIVAVVVGFIWNDIAHHHDGYGRAMCNGRLSGCLGKLACGLGVHDASVSFSVGNFTMRGEIHELDMWMVHTYFMNFLYLAAFVWVLGVAVTTPRCCRLPVASRAAVEQLAREIDGAGAAGELPQLHPNLKPEGLSGVVMKTGFALLDILTDLNTIATFIVTSNFWFAGILWTVFLASLGSELVKGNIQALPKELKRTLVTGVVTERLIDFLDADKGFEAPFSLAITVYSLPFVAFTGNVFLVQCFSLFTSSVGIAGFLTNYTTHATLADQPDVGESTAAGEAYRTLQTAEAGGREEPDAGEPSMVSGERYQTLQTAGAGGQEEQGP